jgi:hypothetical protein
MTWRPTPDEWPSIRRMLLALLTILAVTLALLSCGQAEPAPRPAPTPAEDRAATLRAIAPPATEEVVDLRRQEVDAGLAAAHAVAAGDQLTAERQRALATELGRLRAAAEQREREQQAALDRRILAADQLATAERLAAQRQRDQEAVAAAARAVQARRDRWILWSGLALGGAVVLGGVLLALKLPFLVAVGMPTSIAAGAIVLASWLSVPWLAVAIGCLLGLLILVGLAWLVRYLVAEWQRYAEYLPTTMRNAADTSSRDAQPRLIRYALDRLLGAA